MWYPMPKSCHSEGFNLDLHCGSSHLFTYQIGWSHKSTLPPDIGLGCPGCLNSTTALLGFLEHVNRHVSGPTWEHVLVNSHFPYARYARSYLLRIKAVNAVLSAVLSAGIQNVLATYRESINLHYYKHIIINTFIFGQIVSKIENNLWTKKKLSFSSK